MEEKEIIAVYVFGFLSGASLMALIMRIMLGSIKREVSEIRKLLEERKRIRALLERDLE